MGTADIVGFAVCWVFAAAVLTWGVFSERHRGRRTSGATPVPARRGRRAGGRLRPAPRLWRRRVARVPVLSSAHRDPSPPGPLGTRPASPRWIVVQSLPGSGPEVRAEGELVFAAALAARGLEPSDLRPGDRKVEVTYHDEGGEVTVFLLRSGVLTPAEPA